MPNYRPSNNRTTPRPTRRDRLADVATCAVLFSLFAAAAHADHASSAPVKAAAPVVDCHEDEPCFNWADMGNGARGVVLKGHHHTVTVVNVCDYAYLRSVGAIDRKRTPSLKGDGYARDYRGTCA